MLDDALFVNLARKTGYPSQEELLRCRATQIAWARDGNTISLLEVCFAQGALSDKQFQRYERWAKQIAAADAGPITQTVASPSGAEETQVIHDSAAELKNYKPRCDRCGKETDELGLRETLDRKKICAECFVKPPPRTPSAPKTPAAVAPMSPSGSAARKKGVVNLLKSSGERLAALVRRSPRRDKNPPGTAGRSPAHPGSAPPEEASSKLVPLVALALGLLAVGGGLWFFTRDEPVKVSKKITPKPPGPPAAGPLPAPPPLHGGGSPATPPPPGPVSSPPPVVPVPVPPPLHGGGGPDPEPPPPPPPPAPPGPSDLDRLNADPNFNDAKEGYARAEELYKTGFAGKTETEKQRLRDARKLLEKARTLLDKLPQDLGDAAETFDQLSAKVNSLLHDVEKRQGATGN